MPAACLPTVRASLTNGPRRDRVAHASHSSSKSDASSGVACSRMIVGLRMVVPDSGSGGGLKKSSKLIVATDAIAALSMLDNI